MIIHTIVLCLVWLYALASLLVFGLLMGACLMAKRPLPGPAHGAVNLSLTRYRIEDHQVMCLVNPAKIAA